MISIRPEESTADNKKPSLSKTSPAEENPRLFNGDKLNGVNPNSAILTPIRGIIQTSDIQNLFAKYTL